LFVPSIVCLLLALQWGGTTYAWNDGRIVALLTLFAFLLLAFFGVQLWMGEFATVPPRIMAQRTIAFSSLFSVLLGGAFFLLIYFLPIWFQAIKGTDALQSGIDSIPLILTMTLGIILSGGLTTKFGYYMPYVYAYVILTSIGAGLITTFTPNTSIGKWIDYQILFGFGCGLAFQLPQIAAQTVLPLPDVAQGVAITFFAETLGGALFVSVGNNVLNTRLVELIGALNIPSVDPLVVVRLGATQLRSYVAPQYVTQTVVAYNQALIKTFQVSLILACLSALGAIGMEWKSVHAPVVKPKADKEANTTTEVSVSSESKFMLLQTVINTLYMRFNGLVLAIDLGSGLLYTTFNYVLNKRFNYLGFTLCCYFKATISFTFP
jgi:MFS family permease